MTLCEIWEIWNSILLLHLLLCDLYHTYVQVCCESQDSVNFKKLFFFVLNSHMLLKNQKYILLVFSFTAFTEI